MSEIFDIPIGYILIQISSLDIELLLIYFEVFWKIQF